MKEALPINIEVLKWARKSLGLSIKEVALKVKRTEKEIKEWETGKSSPTYPQLERLAYNIYKRPIAIFFFPNIPDEETPRTDFRTLPEIIIGKLPVEIIRLYRKAKEFQLNLAELFDDSKPISPNLIDDYSMEDITSIETLASNIRSDLKIKIEDQFSWRYLDIAFKNWREAFENRGIFVFKDAFYNDDYSGFCVYDDKYPIIYINNSMPISRQIFTLFHELGHLLYHLGGIDFRDNRIIDKTNRKYQLYEKNCNRFANEILVPSTVFRTENLQVSEKNIEYLADKYSVSREVILRNFWDMKLINDNYYNKMVKKWAKEAEKSKKASKGGNYYYNKITYLGNTYINIVFRKYYQNKITIENLSNYLNIKESNISSFEHYAFG